MYNCHNNYLTFQKFKCLGIVVSGLVSAKSVSQIICSWNVGLYVVSALLWEGGFGQWGVAVSFNNAWQSMPMLASSHILITYLHFIRKIPTFQLSTFI